MSMIPEPDDGVVNIPITFDYKGGRGEHIGTQVLYTVVGVVLSIVLCLGVLTSDTELIPKVLITSIILLVVSFYLRYIVWKEGVYRKVLDDLKEKDYEVETACFWKIYDVDINYPYTCHYINGLKGIFVKMEKDIIVGKGENMVYDHFEGISEALNLASNLNLNIYHIDYMDTVGNDKRLLQLQDSLPDVENTIIQSMLASMYTHLQEEMEQDYATHDVYLFYSRDKIESFEYNVHRVCDTMLGGNFLSYKILDGQGVRALCKSLMHLEDFSAYQASEAILKDSNNVGIVPIRVVDSTTGETRIVGKTVAQKRRELEERQKEDELRRKEKKKKHNKKKTKGNKKKEKIKEPRYIGENIGEEVTYEDDMFDDIF